MKGYNMKKILEFISFKVRQLKIDYRVWVLKNAFKDNPELEKKFISEKYHKILMAKVMQHLEDSPKYDPESDENNSWFVGAIPEDWEDRIDAKIEEKNQEG